MLINLTSRPSQDTGTFALTEIRDVVSGLSVLSKADSESIFGFPNIPTPTGEDTNGVLLRHSVIAE